MNLLIIGDAFSQYTIAFSRFLKQYDPTIKIDIVNIRIVESNKVSIENFVNVYDKVYRNGILNKFILRIPKLRGLVTILRQKKILNEVDEVLNTYDAICIHGFWETSLNIFNKLNATNIFTVGAIWGSDFYRRESDDETLFRAFDRCDRVVISTDEMIKDVQKAYPIPVEKIRKCIFGLEPLETLIKMKDVSPAEAKSTLGLKENPFVITCGYNGNPFQEHLAIIDTFTKIRSKLPSSYILLFPVTYGGSKEYLMTIKENLLKSGLNFKMMEEYLTDEKVANLRLATDLFIQVQKTDALSGSMREHLFAKNIIITGEWLPYQSLVNDGVYYETINNLDELGVKVVDVIKNYTVYKQKVDIENTPDKFESFRWPVSIKKWHQTFLEYKSLKNE